MKSRIPFAATVVGALLVGGATTGTTYASWTDQAPLAATSTGSGRLAVSASAPAGITVLPLAASTTSMSLTDTSVGKNLRQQVVVSVASAPSGVTATVGASCPGAASTQVTTTPGATRTLCVQVSAALVASSGTVTLDVAGAQLGGGWSTATSTVSFPVTVVPSVPPVPPVIACEPRSGNTVSFSWTELPGETYTVERSSTSASSGFGVVTSSGSSPHVVTPDKDTVEWWRVKAVKGAASSGYGNVVRISRENGANTIECGAP